MMFSNFSWRYSLLAILTPLALANPLSSRQQSPCPHSTFSKGFKLIANVTDRAHDLSPPIHGWALEGAHVGAGLNSAVLNNTTPGMVFYQNGTANEVYRQTSNILTDAATPLTPYGLIMCYPNDTDKVVALGIDGGSGTPGITLTNSPYPMTELSAEWQFIVVKAFRDEYQIPDNCVVVEFLPQCAKLPGLPAGSYSTHEFANTVRCFEDPANIDWSKYPEVR